MEYHAVCVMRCMNNLNSCAKLDDDDAFEGECGVMNLVMDDRLRLELVRGIEFLHNQLLMSICEVLWQV